MKKEYPERIKYETWSNSQLSIAKYYGGIMLNGRHYILDYYNCPKKAVFGEDIKYFPDLVLESSLKRKTP